MNVRRAYGSFIVLVLVGVLLFGVTPTAFASHNECHDDRFPPINELLCAIAERPEPDPEPFPIDPDQILAELEQKLHQIYCGINPEDPNCSGS